MKKILFYLLAFLAFGLGGYAFYGYIFSKPGSTSSPEMFEVYNSTIANTAKIMIHAGSASLALMIGIPQLSRRWRERYPRTNVVFRNIYFAAVIIASLSGFALAFIAQGGLPNLFGFSTLSAIWLFSCIKAIIAIKKGDIPAYRLWMVRNYMLTSTAINLRILLGLWAITQGGQENIPVFYQTLGYLTWVPTFIITEWFILPYLNNRIKR
jgi:uncharacterized membrane protein